MTLSNFPNGIRIDGFVTIDENGIILDKTVFNDLRIPVTSTKLGGSKDPGFAVVLDNGSGSQGVFAYLFDAGTEEEIYFICQLPHNWKKETSIYPHIHWFPVSNGSAGQQVSWGLEYSVQKIGSVFGNSTIIYGNDVYPVVTSLIAKTHYITSLGIISMTAIDTISSMLICRLFRDATATGGTDSYGSDVALLEIDFHYEIDSIGTFTEYHT